MIVIMLSHSFRMFEAPVTPLDENESTSSVIPASTSDAIIEQAVEDIPGRVNIVGNVMYRDMPECLSKAALSTTWGRLYGDYLARHNIFIAGGTGGTRYVSGNLLSPDLSAWNLHEPQRHQNEGVTDHLMKLGAAPNWVLEFEWQGEINKARKGVRKVLEGYFHEVGTNQSRVDEGWVMVRRQDVPVHNAPPPPFFFVRLLRWFSYLPLVGTLFYYFLRILDVVTGVQWFTGRCLRRNIPPVDPAVPYIIIFYRENNPQLYGYFWLHWHEHFSAPELSIYSRAAPVSVNPLLEMMRAQA